MTSAMSRIGENLQKALGGSMNFNADAFANAFQFNMTEDDLTELMMSMSGTQSASYDNNLRSSDMQISVIRVPFPFIQKTLITKKKW